MVKNNNSKVFCQETSIKINMNSNTLQEVSIKTILGLNCEDEFIGGGGVG